MPVNIKKLAERLRQFEEGAKASEFAKLLWKPKEGIQVVRIVPYMFSEDSPFVELRFYYKFAGHAQILAPCTFNKPDPILDMINTLRSSGSNEEKDYATKLGPSTRTFAPVIVRGEEELGVRYWGFGVQVYKQLLSLMTDSEWGDITSWTEGTDLTVEFHKISNKKNSKGESFPETKIIPKRNKSPVVDPTRRDLMEKVKQQVDITTIYPLKSHDELKEIVRKWLNPSNDKSNPQTFEETADQTMADSAAQTPSVAPAAATPPTPTTPEQTKAMSEEFEEFFKPKK